MKPVLVLAVVVAMSALEDCTRPQPASFDTTGVEVETERARALDALVSECPRGSPDCSPANEPKLDRSKAPLPVGAAGFELGMTENEAEQHCRAAGEMWSVDSRDLVECSGSAGKKLPFRVNLQLCDGNVCRIILTQHVAEIRRAVERWSAVTDDLAHKYGSPGEREISIPNPCAKVDALAACLERGSAKVQAAWVWGTGHAVTTWLNAPSPEHLFLFVVYSDPAVGRAVHAHGL